MCGGSAVFDQPEEALLRLFNEIRIGLTKLPHASIDRLGVEARVAFLNHSVQVRPAHAVGVLFKDGQSGLSDAVRRGFGQEVSN